MALTASSAGAAHHALGWSVLNLLVLPFILVTLLSIARLGARHGIA